MASFDGDLAATPSTDPADMTDIPGILNTGVGAGAAVLICTDGTLQVGTSTPNADPTDTDGLDKETDKSLAGVLRVACCSEVKLTAAETADTPGKSAIFQSLAPTLVSAAGTPAPVSLSVADNVDDDGIPIFPDTVIGPARSPTSISSASVADNDELAD